MSFYDLWWMISEKGKAIFGHIWIVLLLGNTLKSNDTVISVPFGEKIINTFITQA